MKAIVFTEYGSPDVLRHEEIDKPSPGNGEVLVRVLAASINAADWHLIRGKPLIARLSLGLLKPKHQVPGLDMSGRVEAVGRDVKQFKAGDEVFADLSASGFGAFAEYACVPEHLLALKPENLTFEESAALPCAAITALQALRDEGQLSAGKKVLINGASGGVGTFAVQIAKAFGAVVTAVGSTGKLDLLRALGADHVIDYTKQNFTILAAQENGPKYDLILAANGYHPILAYKRSLKPGGRYVMTGGTSAQLFQALFLGPLLSRKGKKLGALLAKPGHQDLFFLKSLIETGKIKPVIERTYKLGEVPEAIRYLEEGHARGKLVITVQ
ncbi:NAD(P)-dependent alcohol dehydrogenase [Persicitalea jodogahamensis]|uniref:NADPH:quinone reductase n=1 Tax=Persicitalea jodogahamensis TaxID=402147 RepID=A0A8J3D5E0_9BACT|nr:NAD(P)-dependent alcohol dehydrogenase [Persicitalea jodogahamensis]GHB76510.1 NADPH:quinone reductase [Persicitalea jodogahamensis]